MNSKRLFVTKSDVFTLSVLFSKEGDLEIKTIKEVPAEELDKWERCDVEFILPDFGTAKGIMSQSSIIDNGQQVFVGSRFNNNLLTALARKWNLKTEEGEEIPLDFSKLNELRPDIVLTFISLLIEKLNKEGLYEALLST